jgi:general secretion pathway protein D
VKNEIAEKFKFLIFIFLFTTHYLLFTILTYAQPPSAPLHNQATEKENKSSAPKQIYIAKLKHTKASDMVKVLEKLLREMRVHIDEQRNEIIVYDTEEVIKEVKKVIEQTDTPVKQAIIAIEVIEIVYSDTKQLGWELSNYSLGIQSITPPEAEKITKDTVSSLFPGIVKFAGEKAEVKVKAAPKLMVIGNQKASFSAGDKLPLQITQTQVIGGQIAQTTSIQWEEVGVKMDILVDILEEDEFLIEIKGDSNSVGKLTPQGYPQISIRHFETTLKLKNKWRAVLGGLLKEEDRITRIGIPLLMDIPLLGYLFSSNKVEKVISEVRIGITPIKVTEEILTSPNK